MAVPKKRKSRSKSKMRRAARYLKVKPPQLHKCSRCDAVKRTHSVCPSCGYYKDRLILP